MLHRLWVFARDIGFTELQNAVIKRMHKHFIEYRDEWIAAEGGDSIYMDQLVFSDDIKWVWAHTSDHDNDDAKLRDFLIDAQLHLAFQGDVERSLPEAYYVRLISQHFDLKNESFEEGAAAWSELDFKDYYVGRAVGGQW